MVFSAGIRPRDELARAAGLTVGERGGIVDRSSAAAPPTPTIYAIGECASYEGRCYGLVAPGYQMAAAAVADLTAAATIVFTGFDMSTKLKLMGVDVASFGDAFGSHAGAHVISLLRHVSRRLQEAGAVAPTASTCWAACWSATPPAYGELLQLAQNQIVLPPAPEELILPAGARREAGRRRRRPRCPDGAQICSCNNVDKGAICSAIRDAEADRGRRGQELHQGGHRPAGRACRW